MFIATGVKCTLSMIHPPYTQRAEEYSRHAGTASVKALQHWAAQQIACSDLISCRESALEVYMHVKSRELNIPMAIASRTPTPKVAKAFMNKLGTTLKERAWFFGSNHVLLSMAF